jgi:hypothetical protein
MISRACEGLRAFSDGRQGCRTWLVMPAPVADIHVLNPFEIEDFDIKHVDGRDKPRHDG